MKKDEFVKLGVDEDTAAKLETASQEELKGYIPKARFDEVNNEKKKLELDLRDRDGQLETLKNSTGDVESLKQQIETLQADNKAKDEAHAAEMRQLKIDSAVELALGEAKAKNKTAVRALLADLDKAEIAEDGTVKGLNEQLTALRKSDPYLFAETQQKMKGAKIGESADGDPKGITKEQFSKMSYKDRMNLYNENKELYDSLTQE